MVLYYITVFSSTTYTKKKNKKSTTTTTQKQFSLKITNNKRNEMKGKQTVGNRDSFRVYFVY